MPPEADSAPDRPTEMYGYHSSHVSTDGTYTSTVVVVGGYKKSLVLGFSHTYIVVHT